MGLYSANILVIKQHNSEITSGHFDGVALGTFSGVRISGVTISSPYDGDAPLLVEWSDTRNNKISVSVKAPNKATAREVAHVAITRDV